MKNIQGAQNIFIALLTGEESIPLEEISTSFYPDLYIYNALLGTVSSFIKEQHWLKEKESSEGLKFNPFLFDLFKEDVPKLLFLVDHLSKKLEDNGLKHLKKLDKRTLKIEEDLLKLVIKFDSNDKADFLRSSLDRMMELFLLEEKLQEGREISDGHRGPCLYRTFDGLDDIFQLDYQLDRDMKITEVAKERLYEGAGVGVQSGYSTILLALEGMKAKEGAKVVDLGSGYGRVGLVCALLRDDLEFIGYEYVPHRVDVSKRATSDLQLQEKLCFEVQDLSLESFQIPKADIYYLYDPFTYETYQYILKQIVEISESQEVTIVTKGNARSWLEELATEKRWPAPVVIDEGNLCIFRSHSK
jgi:methylase of polypeptide subunit release factors